MLDFRHETFLTLARVGSYTGTAKLLNITQPAVSQHIRYLEDYYGCKLFCYKNKTITLTPQGEKLLAFAQTARSDVQHLRGQLQGDLTEHRLRFGATLSIGDYLCPNILQRLLLEYPDLIVDMQVSNTQRLLEELQSGALDFALVEGFFDRSSYGSALFSREAFVAVVAPGHPLAKGEHQLSELFSERLLVRESGSGSRSILEQALFERNLRLEQFSKVSQIGSIRVILELAKNGVGITFLYKVAALEALKNGHLCEIAIADFSVHREFNLVYLNNSQHKAEYLAWMTLFAGGE